MALTLGQAVIELAINSATWRADLAKASNDFKGFTQGVKSAASGIAIAAVAVAMFEFTKRSLEAGEAIERLAQRTGVGIQALQELQHAAASTGVETGELESGIRHLQVAMTEAARGSSAEAVDLFRRLGISATDSAGGLKTVEDTLGDFADAITRVKNPAEQADLAVKAFGRTGTSLLPMLKGGRDGLAAMGEEARRLGKTVDTEVVLATAKASQELQNIAAVIKSDAIRSVAGFIPVIKELADAFRFARDMAHQFFSTMTPDSALGIKDLEQRIADVTARLEGLNAAGRLIQRGGAFMAPPKGAGNQALIDQTQAELDGLKKLLEARKKANAEPERAAGGVLGPSKQQLDTLDAWRQKLLTLSIPDETARRLVELRNETKKVMETAGPAAAAILDIAKAMEAIITETAATTALKESAKAVDEALAAITKGTQDAIASQKEELNLQDELQKAYGASAAASTQLAESVGERLARRVADTEAIWTKFRETLGHSHPTIETLGKDLANLRSQLKVEQEIEAITKGTQDALRAADASDAAFTAMGKAMKQAFESPDEAFIRKANDALDLYNRSAIDAETRDRAIIAAKSDLVAAYAAQAGALTKLTEETKLAGLLGENVDMPATKRLGALREELAKLSAEGRNGTEEWARLKAEFDDTKPFADMEKAIDGVFNSIANTLATSIQGVLLGTQSIGDAFKNLGQNIALSLIESAVKRLLKSLEDQLITFLESEAVREFFKFLLNLGVSAVGGASGGVAGGGGGGGGEVALASGGVVTRPTHALVGESGPEAVIPLSRLGGGEVTFNVLIINQTGSPVSSKTEQRTGPDGMKQLKVFLTSNQQDSIANGSLDGVLSAAFGIKRRGVSR